MLETTVIVSAPLARAGANETTCERLVTPMKTSFERIQALKHYRTLYEIVVEHSDGRRLLVAYSSQNSRSGLLDAMRSRGPEIVAYCGLSDDANIVFAGGGATISDAGKTWSVRFSGRTQRECIRSGELQRLA